MNFAAPQSSRKWLAAALAALFAALFAAFYWLFVFEPASDPPGPSLSDLDCPDELHAFLDCVRKHMPTRSQPGVYVSPDQYERDALSKAASALFARSASSTSGCSIKLPDVLQKRYATTVLEHGTMGFCALWEAAVTKGRKPLGWGTLIVNRTPSRHLVLGAPHPLSDIGTATQAAELLV
ncbi:MAG: hypothetical protein O7H39_01295, partial [Gammaproteobacteria bacterium]|nr:hypothetical protein [Gammaproteobacteria bacterium]